MDTMGPVSSNRRSNRRGRAHRLVGVTIAAVIVAIGAAGAVAIASNNPLVAVPATSPTPTGSVAKIQLSAPKPVLYAATGAAAVTGTARVTNNGGEILTVSGATLQGSTSLALTPVGGFTLAAGQSQDLTFTFTPRSSGPQRSILQVTSNAAGKTLAYLALGGLAIPSPSTSEPSLQWIVDSFGIKAHDGDPRPSTYSLDATSLPPSGGVLVTGFTRRDATKPIQVTTLGTFVNPATASDPTKNPTWGWTAKGVAPASPTASYAVRRDLIGTAYTISPRGPFGLWAQAEGTLMRTDLNTAAAPRFIAFPVDATPGTYVIAIDTTGRTKDDWNDLPLLITNVNLTG